MRKDSIVITKLFETYLNAETFSDILIVFRELCDHLNLNPKRGLIFYQRIKNKIKTWKATGLWAKLDKKCSQKIYKGGAVCENINVLVVGAGPCGLRTAIELAMLGCQVVVAEKRDKFSRNNVIHLWPFVLHDLRSLGAKKFFAQFCAGAIDHISIRKLQTILLKVALLLGVTVYENVEFVELNGDAVNQKGKGWRAKFLPTDHPLSQYDFDVMVGAEGKKNTLKGFSRKEFRGKLAIAITSNFVNRHTDPENRIEEISGVSSIFNPKFFSALREEKGIDLENVVYYKDDTHYFVMTAKKQSLLEKGVIKTDIPDAASLLHRGNVDTSALHGYAREVAEFCTGGALNFTPPEIDPDPTDYEGLGIHRRCRDEPISASGTPFATNHYGEPDVSMFDFTSMFQAENAARIVERDGCVLLIALVGDCLLEPFWPLGTGCPRGFLSSYDAAWMVRQWALGKYTPLQVLAERESIYKLLSQTSHENICKNYALYSPDPRTRYPNLDPHLVKPFQVRHLYDTDIENFDVNKVLDVPLKKLRKSTVHREITEISKADDPNEYENLFNATDFATNHSLRHKSLKSITGIQTKLMSNGNGHPTENKDSNRSQVRCVKPTIKTSIDPYIPNDTSSPPLHSKPYKINRLRYFDSPKSIPGIDAPPSSRRKDVSIKGMVDIKKIKRQISQRESPMLSGNSPTNHSLSPLINRHDIVGDRDEPKLDKIAAMAQLLTSKLGSTYHRPILSAITSPLHPGTGGNKADDQRALPKGRLHHLSPIQNGQVDTANLSCHFCGRSLYIMDLTRAENAFFHGECLRCQECGKALTLGNYFFKPPAIEEIKSPGTFLCRIHAQTQTEQAYDRLLKERCRERLHNHPGLVASNRTTWQESNALLEESQIINPAGSGKVLEKCPSVLPDRTKLVERREKNAKERSKLRHRSPTPGQTGLENCSRRYSSYTDAWSFIDENEGPEPSPVDPLKQHYNQTTAKALQDSSPYTVPRPDNLPLIRTPHSSTDLLAIPTPTRTHHTPCPTPETEDGYQSQPEHMPDPYDPIKLLEIQHSARKVEARKRAKHKTDAELSCDKMTRRTSHPVTTTLTDSSVGTPSSPTLSPSSLQLPPLDAADRYHCLYADTSPGLSLPTTTPIPTLSTIANNDYVQSKPVRYSMRKSLLRKRLLLNRRRSGLGAASVFNFGSSNLRKNWLAKGTDGANRGRPGAGDVSWKCTASFRPSRDVCKKSYKYSPWEDGVASYRPVKSRMHQQHLKYIDIEVPSDAGPENHNVLNEDKMSEKICAVKDENESQKILDNFEAPNSLSSPDSVEVHGLNGINDRETPPIISRPNNLPPINPFDRQPMYKSPTKLKDIAPLTPRFDWQTQNNLIQRIYHEMADRIRTDLGIHNNTPLGQLYHDILESPILETLNGDTDEDCFDEMSIPVAALSETLESSVVTLLLETLSKSCETVGFYDSSKCNYFTECSVQDPQLGLNNELDNLSELQSLSLSSGCFNTKRLSERLTAKVQHEAGAIEARQRMAVLNRASALDQNLRSHLVKRSRIARLITRVSASLADLSPDLDMAARLLNSNRTRLLTELKKVQNDIREVEGTFGVLKWDCARNYLKCQLRKLMAVEDYKKTAEQKIEQKILTNTLLDINEGRDDVTKSMGVEYVEYQPIAST